MEIRKKSLNQIFRELKVEFIFKYIQESDIVIYSSKYENLFKTCTDSFIYSLVEEYKLFNIKADYTFIHNTIRFLGVTPEVVSEYFENLPDWNPNNPSEISKFLSSATTENQEYFTVNFKAWILHFVQYFYIKKEFPTISLRTKTLKYLSKLWDDFFPIELKNMMQIRVNYITTTEVNPCLTLRFIDFNSVEEVDLKKVYMEAKYLVLKGEEPKFKDFTY